MSDVPSETARTNRLADATSPYLLQHAHDPVEWYPWGPEAFAKAAAENKPIFLSIGYSACHWCHVMAHECFRDDEIAAILNRHFVSIKVDREERPDVDEIYMTATLLCTQGHGGWPMSVFLLPDGRPFFAGTYFPARSRHGQPGFQDILLEIVRRWHDDRADFEQGATELTQAIRRLSTLVPGADIPGPDLIERAIRQYQRAFDRRHGGILSGGTNKFPPAMSLQLMLRRCRNGRGPGPPATASDRLPEDDILHLVELTLERMARGGIYDQLGGGICRYSTDPQWLVPHFEKMLYDQALVSDAFLDAFQLTRRPLYRRIAGEILDFVLREMTAPEGAFYTAFDADSEGVEGKYYLWTLDEIRQVLGERDAACFAAAYGVSPNGNWHNPHAHAPTGPTNILHMPHSLASVACTLGMTEGELEASLERSRRRLLEARARRTPPGLDDKILTAWNGLMITSLARGSRILDEPRYLRAATRAADFLLTTLVRNGRLLRTCRAGRAHTPGFLDDYAFLIEGLIHLYETSFEPRWLDHAVRLLRDTIEHFLDPQGGFFFTADDCRTALFRPRETADGALPSGNSVMAMNLLRLAALLDRPEWRACAESVFRAFAGRLAESPLGFDRLLAALDFFHTEPTQVVIVGPSQSPQTQALVRALWQVYMPAKVVAGLDPTDGPAKALARNVPLLRDRAMVGGRPTAYVCRGFTCGTPATDEDLLLKQLVSPRG